MMNNERREHMISANDRLRNSMIKQKLTITEKTGGLPVETVVSKLHLAKHTYAPDMV